LRFWQSGGGPGQLSRGREVARVRQHGTGKQPDGFRAVLGREHEGHCFDPGLLKLAEQLFGVWQLDFANEYLRRLAQCPAPSHLAAQFVDVAAELGVVVSGGDAGVPTVGVFCIVASLMPPTTMGRG
jgi:hypothetical protein